ncbi:unnamed protein product [Cercospora beticola]|nr:unnamed protein product [Cercospora beticola]
MNSIDERNLAETIERDDSIPASTIGRRASARLQAREPSMTERSDTRSPTVSWSSQLSSRSASTASTALSSVSDNESDAIVGEDDSDLLSLDGNRRGNVKISVERDFDVDRVLAKRVENGVVWYKVRWKPMRLPRIQTELNEEGQWTVEIDNSKWRGVLEVRPVDFFTCEVVWKDSERPVWRLGHAIASIAEWHERNPEDIDANEPQFWLGHKDSGLASSTTRYVVPEHTDFFIHEDEEYFAPKNIDHTKPLLEYCLRRSKLSPSAVRLLNRPIRRLLIFSQRFRDSGKEIEIGRPGTFKALLTYCVGEVREKPCSMCARGNSAFPYCVYFEGVAEGVCVGCVVRGGCETSCESHNSHRAYHDGAKHQSVRHEDVRSSPAGNRDLDVSASLSNARSGITVGGQVGEQVDSEVTGSMPVEDPFEHFFEPASEVASSYDEDFLDPAATTTSNHGDEDLPNAPRFQKPYTRTPTAELYASTPRPPKLLQLVAGGCIVGEHPTMSTRSPTLSQQTAASYVTAAYSTPPTQSQASSERAAEQVPGNQTFERADQERCAPGIQRRIHNPAIPQSGASKMTSTKRMMNLPIRSTPAPRSSSTLRASPADSRVSQTDSAKAPSSVFHTPPQSTVEVQKLGKQGEEPVLPVYGKPDERSATRPDVSSSGRLDRTPDLRLAEKPDAQPVDMPDDGPGKKPEIEQKDGGKKRAAPDHAPEDVTSFKQQEQPAPESDAHQSKRVRHASSSSPRTKSETHSATKILFLNDHLHCTLGRPCIDPIATFADYTPPRTPLVYNDREFEENEATVEEVRYIVSQCQCTNAEILSKLARGSFEKLWRKGELESEDGEEWSVEGNLSGRFWQELNKAVKLVCPVRGKGKGGKKKVVIDLT